jgi:hypothetical protein
MSLTLLGAGPSGVGVGGPTDPNFASVKLLVGANGTNGSSTIPDESGAAHGNGTAISTTLDTSQFKFGPSSILFTGALTQAVQWSSSSDWDLGSGNFTIECWIRTTTVGATISYIVARWNTTGTQAYVLFRSGDTLRWNTSTTGSDNFSDITTGSVLSINTWYAVCIDFDGSKYRIYLDGTMVGSFSTPRTLFNPSNTISIGGSSAGSPSNSWVGWIDEVRLTKGVARYASDGGYTVPIAAFPRS